MSYPSVQSPAAYIPAILVCILSSTQIPRLTFAPSAFASPIFALTPTARTSTSNSVFTPLFITAVLPSKLSTLSESMNFMPYSSRCFWTRAALSVSRMLERTRSARSQTVISATLSLSPSAHLSPIRPAPTIRTLDFSFISFSRASASSSAKNENFFSTLSSPENGGTKGEEPVAIQIFV